MVECAMMNKYKYMKMISSMAKFFFIKSRVKTEKRVPFLPDFLQKKNK